MNPGRDSSLPSEWFPSFPTPSIRTLRSWPTSGTVTISAQRTRPFRRLYDKDMMHLDKDMMHRPDSPESAWVCRTDARKGL